MIVPVHPTSKVNEVRNDKQGEDTNNGRMVEDVMEECRIDWRPGEGGRGDL